MRYELEFKNKRKMPIGCSRTYLHSQYSFPLTWYDRLRLLFTSSIHLNTIPSSLVNKVGHATSVYFIKAVYMETLPTDSFMLGNKHIAITGSLFFEGWVAMIDYFMGSQEDKKREYVAGYQVNSNGSILIRYGKIDSVCYSDMKT